MQASYDRLLLAMKRASRADVAREAGVSKTTVTYVLRNTPNTSISEETKSRVRAAADRLGYVPHFAASSLVRGKTEVIGVLIPSAKRQFYSLYAAFLEGVVEESHDSPYTFLYVAQDQPAKYRRVLGQRFVDGMIVIQSSVNEEHVQAVRSYDRPILAVNYLPPTVQVPAISADYEGALDLAHDWLIHRNRTHAAVFIVDNDLQPNRRQIRHHPVMSAQLSSRIHSTLVRSSGTESFSRAWTTSFDAIVVEGGNQLRTLLPFLRERGIRIGEDVDIVAMNIADSGSGIQAGVHVVESPSQDIGRGAWRLMERLLRGEPVAERTLVPFLSYTT